MLKVATNGTSTLYICSFSFALSNFLPTTFPLGSLSFRFPVPLLSSVVISNFLHLDCLFGSPFPMRFPFRPPCSFAVASSSCLPLIPSFIAFQF